MRGLMFRRWRFAVDKAAHEAMRAGCLSIHMKDAVVILIASKRPR
jgi:hypothetical protein